MSMLDQVHPETGEVLVSPEVRGPRQAISEARRYDLETGSDSFVQQSFIDECDINNIVRRYQDTGSIGPQDRQPIFGDFSSIPDYQDAFDIVHAAAESFAALPSDVRTRFANDPGLMMAFLADPANLEESYTLGLRQKPVPSEADRIVAAIEGQAPQAAEAPSGASS